MTGSIKVGWTLVHFRSSLRHGLVCVLVAARVSVSVTTGAGLVCFMMRLEGACR